MKNLKTITATDYPAEGSSHKREARLTCGRKQKLPDHIVQIAENAQKHVDCNFGALLAKNNMRNVDMLDKMYPIIRDHSHMTKLLSGEQHVNMKLLVALHYVLGIDLNEFVAADTSSRTIYLPGIQQAIDLLQEYCSTCKDRK